MSELLRVGRSVDEIALVLFEGLTARARAESAQVATWDEVAPYFRDVLRRQAVALRDAFPELCEVTT